MPKIILKPNSPEYAEPETNAASQTCDMPGCPNEATHKAPKHRGLNEHHNFCFEHVREYNSAWDYFSGMNADEVEDHMNKSVYGFRPTWRYDQFKEFEDNLRSKAWQTYEGVDHEEREETRQAHGTFSQNSPEYEAMAIMGLSPPVTLEDIKKKYKELAKKHHPDLNKGCPKSEEMLKKINMSYTMLKLAYAEFEALPERAK